MTEIQSSRTVQIKKEVMLAAICEFFESNDPIFIRSILNRLSGIGFIESKTKTVSGVVLFNLNHEVIDKYLNDPLFFIK